MPFLKAAIVGAAASLSLTLLLISTAYARAADAAPQPFDIAPQSLAAALSEFARQSHEELLFAPGVVAQKGTHGVRGTMEPLAALKILLKDSGLSYSTTPAGAILVGSAGNANVASIASVATSAAGQSDDSSARSVLQLAQLDQGQTASPSTVEKQNEGVKKTSVRLEEVVVTGSRIPVLNDQQVQPVQSYTRDQILASGETTLANFLNTLPDVSIAPTETQLHTFLGQTTVQLHGLPTGTTLVLLNGRRVETGYLGFLDLSNIPVSAIERVDVLPVGTSAVYGSDALAGAVNIILRTNLSGFEVNTKITHAADTTEKDADFALGKSWERGGFSLLGSYQNQTALLGFDRVATSSTAAPVASIGLVTDSCFPGTVYSLNGQNLPGLSSPEAAIPVGLTGTPNIADFSGTAGKINHCNAFDYISLLPAATRYGGILSGHYALNESAELFIEVLGSHESQEVESGPLIFLNSAFGNTLGANNPYNPFGEQVGLSYIYPGLLEPYQDTQDLLRPLIGVRGSFADDWHYEATAFVSRDRTNVSLPLASNSAITSALLSSNPATALNPFSSVAPGSPQLLQSFVGGYDNYSYDNRTVDGQAVLRGPLFRLPAGPVQAVIGTEYIRDTEDTILPFGAPPLDLRRTSYAFFGETRIPVLAGRHDGGDQQLLAITLAERYDHSSDFGGKATWQIGTIWKPTESLSFRAGYGTSYRAPPLQDISGGLQGTFIAGGYTDPFRGGQTVPPVTQSFGANPNLKPETGESFALGALFSSHALPGLELSLTYFSVDISDYIGQPSDQTLIDYPNVFPGAVVRAPPTPQDIQNGSVISAKSLRLIIFISITAICALRALTPPLDTRFKPQLET